MENTEPYRDPENKALTSVTATGLIRDKKQLPSKIVPVTLILVTHHCTFLNLKNLAEQRTITLIEIVEPFNLTPELHVTA